MPSNTAAKTCSLAGMRGGGGNQRDAVNSTSTNVIPLCNQRASVPPTNVSSIAHRPANDVGCHAGKIGEDLDLDLDSSRVVDY